MSDNHSVTVRQEELALEVSRAQAKALERHSPATRRAYATDWSTFVRWCEARGVVPLPADRGAVATFISSQADSGLSPSTLQRRLAAIAYMHRLAGHDTPTTTEVVKGVYQGIVRSMARKGNNTKKQKTPTTSDIIFEMVKHAPDNLTGLRDKAIILLGFGGALRRSEIAALNVADIQFMRNGLRLHIRLSKTDQEGIGQIVPITKGDIVCPVVALKEWLKESEITEGPLFRPINKAGEISENRLEAQSVNNIIKHYVALAGYNPKDFGAHSLRAGFATSAVMNGANIFKIMNVTRHKRVDTLQQYVRLADEFQGHAGKGLL